VRSTELGQSRSGIDTFEPDGEDLTRAIDRLADRDVLQRLTLGAARRRDELSWTKTTEAFAALLATESRHRADIDSRVREAKPDSATLPGAGIRR
jgi:anti-sigma-K factor RskA